MSSLSFPNESARYRAARNELLQAELDLRDQIERVAAMRRALPDGGSVPEDYVFADTAGQAVALSSLFGRHDTLLLYSYMFRPDEDRPCPACTSLTDGWNGHYDQVTQRVAFAAVSSATPSQLAALSSARGWKIPLHSAQSTDYQLRYFGETPTGEQHTFMNVFVRRPGSDAILHAWGSEMERVPTDFHTRHLDLTWPLWNLLDLTPEGRGDFFPEVFGR